MLEVLACPVPASLQDLGRPGYRHLGVPLSGALDSEWLVLANALVGNEANSAAIEMRLAGPRLASDADVVFALAGDVDARIVGSSATRPAPPWRGQILRAGEELQVAGVRSGVAYLAFAGGIASRRQLGSRSRFERADLGTPIAAGTRLEVGARGTPAPLRLGLPLTRNTRPIRVIPGPQREKFDDATWQCFVTGDYRVGREADRMGLRLDGPRLAHLDGADIVSDAVTPGAIQVPGDGRPIVLLADCQTVGGYAKIATVVSADLPRLAHALPGERLRFAAVTLADALAAREQSTRALATSLASIAPDVAQLDLDALYRANLIDGVIDAAH